MCWPAASLLLAALLAGPASAEDFEALEAGVRADLSALDPWSALPKAERLASLPNLPPRSRGLALRQLGEVRLSLGAARDAQVALESACEADPSDAPAAYLLAQALREEPEAALRWAEAAASGGPRGTRAAAHRLAGEIRIDLGDAGGARRSLAAALELYPDDLDALRDMALLERAAPKKAAAFAARASVAARAAPLWHRPAALRFSARLWLELGEPARAAGDLAAAVDLDACDLDAWRLLARARREKPDISLPKAAPGPPGDDEGPALEERQARRRLADDPEDLEALRSLPASETMTKFMEAAPRSPAWRQPEAYRLAARRWRDLGDLERARRSILRARELDRESVATGRLMYDLDPGQKDLSSGRETMTSGFMELARAHLALGDPNGAQAVLETALAEFPGEIRLLGGLVQAELARRRPERAHDAAERMIVVSERESLESVLAANAASFALKPKPGAGPGYQAEVFRAALADPAVAARVRFERDCDRRDALQAMVDVLLAQGKRDEARTYDERRAALGADSAEPGRY